MSTSSVSSQNMLMAATFKPLTNWLDRRTFDDKPANNSCYPKEEHFHRKPQVFTYFSHPVDDIIRLFSVPYFATAGHFSNINECLKEGKKFQAVIRIITTPYWWPAKIVLKCAFFVPFVAIQTPFSLIIPYRTIFGCLLKLKNEDNKIQTIPSVRLYLCKEFCKSRFYPLKSKKGIKHKNMNDLNEGGWTKVWIVATALLFL